MFKMSTKLSGEKIKKAIKDAGYTQEKFAKKIGVNRVTITHWITGKRNPLFKSLEKIAMATGKPLSYFFDDLASDLENYRNLLIERLEKLEKNAEMLKTNLEMLNLKIELILEKLKK